MSGAGWPRLPALQEARLFEWQARHAEQTRDWQTRRTAYEQQKHWYAVSLGSDVDRIDVAGGTLSGWSAMLTMIGLPRLQAGGEVTVIDLTDGPVAHDLLAVADRAGLDPLVWVLLGDLPRLDLGTGLEPAALADLLTQVASSPPDSGGGGWGRPGWWAFGRDPVPRPRHPGSRPGPARGRGGRGPGHRGAAGPGRYR